MPVLRGLAFKIGTRLFAVHGQGKHLFPIQLAAGSAHLVVPVPGARQAVGHVRRMRRDLCCYDAVLYIL